MNCQSFESIAGDLARSRDVDDAAREAAETHALGCAACAARLRRERELADGLAALAAASRGREAPERVEAALIAAFRAQAAPAGAPAPCAAPVVPFEPRRRAPRWALAAAASAALAAGAVAWLAGAPGETGHVAANPAVPDPRAVAADAPPAAEVRPGAPPFEEGEVIADAGSEQVRTPERARRGAGTRSPRGPLADRHAGRRPPRDKEPSYRPVEITTDFYPLVAGSGMAPVEGGQVIRIEVPRAQLAAMGFEMNAARPDEPVTADVVLGHDGTARAIRFVQPALMADNRSTRR